MAENNKDIQSMMDTLDKPNALYSGYLLRHRLLIEKSGCFG